jgi:hypothetical protein
VSFVAASARRFDLSAALCLRYRAGRC